MYNNKQNAQRNAQRNAQWRVPPKTIAALTVVGMVAGYLLPDELGVMIGLACFALGWGFKSEAPIFMAAVMLGRACKAGHFEFSDLFGALNYERDNNMNAADGSSSRSFR